jgi:hypothetical protein
MHLISSADGGLFGGVKNTREKQTKSFFNIFTLKLQKKHTSSLYDEQN